MRTLRSVNCAGRTTLDFVAIACRFSGVAESVLASGWELLVTPLESVSLRADLGIATSLGFPRAVVGEALNGRGGVPIR